MKKSISSRKLGIISIATIALIIIVDQWIKISVKSSMTLGESIKVFDWFYIEFVENNGMAYGMTFINKWVLSIFRIIAISGIGYYLYKQVKSKARLSWIVCVSAILAGAAGNIFDSLFYGLCFTASTPFEVAQFVDFGTGYAPVLKGKVVDMFYFPIFHTTWPDWLPIIGGKDYTFFSPVFNFADACISVGVFCVVLFFRKEATALAEDNSNKKDSESCNENTEENKTDNE